MSNTQNGVGLVEVMVALFVISVGMLAVAGLQATGVKAGYSTERRSAAAFYLAELAERMRANPRAAAAGSYDADIDHTALSLTDPGCSDSLSGMATNCSDTDRASQDLFDVYQKASLLLPNLDVLVTSFVMPDIPGGTAADIIEIHFSWLGRGEESIDGRTVDQNRSKFSSRVGILDYLANKGGAINRPTGGGGGGGTSSGPPLYDDISGGGPTAGPSGPVGGGGGS